MQPGWPPAAPGPDLGMDRSSHSRGCGCRHPRTASPAGIRFRSAAGRPPRAGVTGLLRGRQVTVHLQPADPGLEPAGAGGVLLVHAEAVAAALVVVELHRAPGLLPALDQAET